MYETESDSDSEAKERKKIAKEKRKLNRERKIRLEKIPSLPDRVVVIKNADKDVGGWKESWSKPKNRNAGHIIHPFRLLALGGVGRGKTNMLKQIFLKHQSSRKPFKKLFIITCDPDSKEWLDCEPDIVTDQMVDLNMFDSKIKTCCVIDDFEWCKCSKQEQKQLSTLMRFISSHRNVSVLLSFQSFMENRCGLEKQTLKKLFDGKCNGVYDHVLIDKTIGTPYPLRRNIYEPIELSESDSD